MAGRVQIEEEDGRVIVKAPYDIDWKEWCKEQGARWDQENSGWSFDADAWSVRDLEAEARRHFGKGCFG